MQEVVAWLVAVTLALVLGYVLGRRFAPAGEVPTDTPAGRPPVAEGPATGPGDAPDELYDVARRLGPIFEAAARPRDVLDHPTFREGVEKLRAHADSADALIGYYRGESLILACLALAVIAELPRERADVRAAILESINDYATWNRYFALRALEAQQPSGEALVGPVLLRIDESWSWPQNLRVLEAFLRRRLAAGERLELGPRAESMSAETAEELPPILKKLPRELGEPLVASFDEWRGKRVDLELLRSIGRVWDAEEVAADGKVLDHPALLANVGAVQTALSRGGRSSVALVGEHGVGKTAVVRALAPRLAEQGWVVFEAGQAELMAGQSYIGQLEERMRTLIGALRGRKVLWFVPDIHTLALAGRHRYGPQSVLDLALPAIESGEIVALGETTPTAFEQLVQAKPGVLTSLETFRIKPLAEEPTRALIAAWAEDRVDGEAGLPPETREEAWLLAQQYLGDRAAPGNVLKLLELTRQRLATTTAEGRRPCLNTPELITTLTQLTGLPASILDDRQGLDLDALRASFEARVMGQSEAAGCLVERVAMIKAGVCDPGRPLGVFLFAGPTGTGKTEIAKTLAEFLFGSQARLVRLDMSEFQQPESLERILGGSDRDKTGGALIDKVRKQPFSVILLDEFEKAHPNVWDVFLQLFDDGRLTDPAGNTADFRNTIVILTSNLGSAIPTGTSLGFQDASGRFSEAHVVRVVERSFRKEFLNRLDRIVVFRPLSRDTMRSILRKELAEAFSRRGLRTRAWAVEWDESAIEMLLAEGFTVDLGARPLRRAIERHLLAPLALTIVNHQVPAGDQFLLVRAEGGRLDVEFVDPDAVEEDVDAASSPAPPAAREAGLSLEGIALEPTGTAEEARRLQTVWERLDTTVRAETWAGAKQVALARMQAPDFWESGERFATLGFVEYVDRIEAGIRAAGSLIERLAGSDSRRRRYPRKHLARLAKQLFVLDEACRGVLEGQPREAWLQVEAWNESGRPTRHADAFARRIAAMYRKWAEDRRMPHETLHEWGGDGQQAYGLLMAVSGYAAFSLLEAESGLHVEETPAQDGRRGRRSVVRVRVAAQSDTPPADGRSPADEARATLEQRAGSLAIVRRYREKPSPLVRDAVQGWRSGKLDRVLGGDFDLIARIRRTRSGEEGM